MTGPDGKLIIYPLGSEGWIPANGQETVCFAFFVGDELVLLDAGTGVSRLIELSRTIFRHRWPDIKRAHVFITHYHFDHIVGLFWLRAILKGIDVTLYAPGPASYGVLAVEVLEDFFRKPFSPRPLEEMIPGVTVRDLDPPGLKANIDGKEIEVAVKANPEHSDPTVSFRFNDWFAFVTDTPPEDSMIDFVRGVEVLLHEAYFDSFDRFTGEEDSLEKHRGGPHTGSFGAGLIAKRAGIRRLYLMHHNPESTMLEAVTATKRVAENLGIDCRAAVDLEEIEITV
jgi:ribonuclease BN (tRNA processing enzyme)